MRLYNVYKNILSLLCEIFMYMYTFSLETPTCQNNRVDCVSLDSTQNDIYVGISKKSHKVYLYSLILLAK